MVGGGGGGGRRIIQSWRGGGGKKDVFTLNAVNEEDSAYAIMPRWCRRRFLPYYIPVGNSPLFLRGVSSLTGDCGAYSGN